MCIILPTLQTFMLIFANFYVEFCILFHMQTCYFANQLTCIKIQNSALVGIIKCAHAQTNKRQTGYQPNSIFEKSTRGGDKVAQMYPQENFGAAFQKSPFYFSGILQTAFAGLALSFAEKSIIRF